MTVIHYKMKAMSPLLFSERRPAGQFRSTALFVPGASVRGALASQWVESGGRAKDEVFKDEEFVSVFTGPNAALFHNAYPGDGVLPATAWSCKNFSGFGGSEQNDEHGAYDSLIDRLCWEALDDQQRLPFCYSPQCPKCCGRVAALTGFYCSGATDRRLLTPPTMLTTRVGINRERKAAEHGLLYSPLVIAEAKRMTGSRRSERTCFHGSITVNDPEQADIVERRLKALNHVGSSSSRGFGEVKIAITPPTPADDIAARISNFNTCLRTRQSDWETMANGGVPLPLSNDGLYVAVMLRSDAILRRHAWAPTTCLTPDMLAADFGAATLVRSYAAMDYHGGWNTAWGLPKDVEPAVTLGSVFVYHWPDKDETKLAAILGGAEARGVGERRPEGYGQIRVCDPFHLNVNSDQETPA